MANIFYLQKAVNSLKFEYSFHPGFHWGTMTDMTNFNAILFNQDFAKAVWGTTREFHLKKMVISDDPLKYFKENTNF